MRRRVRVTGCKLPGSWPRPGKVTSIAPAASSARSASSSSVRGAPPRPHECAALASLILCPAAGRSAAGSLPKPLSCSVSKPFLPSSRTRTSPMRRDRGPRDVCEGLLDERRKRFCTGHDDSWIRAELARRSGRTSSGSRLAPSCPQAATARLGFFRDGGKCRHVMHREVGEHLAVDGQTRLVQSVDQRAVGQPAQAVRRR